MIIGICAVGVSSQMGPLSKGEEMMSPDHPLVETQRVMLDEFSTGLGTPSTLSVQVTWGIEKLDRSKVGNWDAEDVGEIIWDQTFTVAPPENQ